MTELERPVVAQTARQKFKSGVESEVTVGLKKNTFYPHEKLDRIMAFTLTKNSQLRDNSHCRRQFHHRGHSPVRKLVFVTIS